MTKSQQNKSKKRGIGKDFIGFMLGISLVWSIGLSGFIPYIVGIFFGVWLTHKILSSKEIVLKTIFWILFIAIFMIGSTIHGSKRNARLENSLESIGIFSNQSENEKLNFRIGEYNSSPTSLLPSHIKKGRGFENEKTIEELDKDIKKDPQNARLYHEKGNQYLLDKKFREAVGEFDKAIKINSNYTEPYNGKGIAYRNLGEYSKAVENYTKAVGLDPSYFEAYNNRGVCFIFLGEHSNACLDFEKACELGSCQKLEISKQKGHCE